MSTPWFPLNEWTIARPALMEEENNRAPGRGTRAVSRNVASLSAT